MKTLTEWPNKDKNNEYRDDFMFTKSSLILIRCHCYRFLTMVTWKTYYFPAHHYSSVIILAVDQSTLFSKRDKKYERIIEFAKTQLHYHMFFSHGTWILLFSCWDGSSRLTAGYPGALLVNKKAYSLDYGRFPTPDLFARPPRTFSVLLYSAVNILFLKILV